LLHEYIADDSRQSCDKRDRLPILYKKYGTVFRGAIIVLFSSVSVKYLISLSNLSSKHSMLATLPHLHRDVGIVAHHQDDSPATYTTGSALYCTTPVAVVGRRPHGDQRPVCEHVLQALLHQLVRATDQLQAVDGVELRRDLLDAAALR